MNPGGSVKDRPALSMITAAEQSGALKPGSTLIEATSGNTGISLAMIAAVRGYRCMLVMPEDMSLERRYILRAYGADIVLTPAADGMTGAVKRARVLLEETPSAFMPSQFSNPANPESPRARHRTRNPRSSSTATSRRSSQAWARAARSPGVARTLRAALGNKVRIVRSSNRPEQRGARWQGAGHARHSRPRRRLRARDLRTAVWWTRSSRSAMSRPERMARRLRARGRAARRAVLRRKRSRGVRGRVLGLRTGNVVTILCDSGERYLF